MSVKTYFSDSVVVSLVFLFVVGRTGRKQNEEEIKLRMAKEEKKSCEGSTNCKPNTINYSS